METEYTYTDSEDRSDVMESLQRFVVPQVENYKEGRYLLEIVNQDCNYIYIRLIDRHTRKYTWTTELLKRELWETLTSITAVDYTLEILRTYNLIH